MQVDVIDKGKNRKKGKKEKGGGKGDWQHKGPKGSQHDKPWSSWTPSWKPWQSRPCNSWSSGKRWQSSHTAHGPSPPNL